MTDRFIHGTYAALYRPGRAWIPDRPITGQPLGAHAAYLLDLHARDKVLMGGPFANGRGGLVILRAADAAEAEALIAADPAVAAGVLAAEVHPWRRLA
ncbi:MAG: hypothetical protein H6907_04440 [Hyphomicrobiales bacterium]|nr:hypothetical protein [Hyphomicrobiales bacterium]